MNHTTAEMMTVAAARALSNDDICFVGIGLPSAACNLARLTHAPKITLIYESGTIRTRPSVLPLSIGDGELCETALTTVSVPEMFRYWLQGGRITVGFLSGAQVDRFGNLNSTVIGDYRRPTVRLPGSGGATEIATSCGEIFIIMRQSKRSFVGETRLRHFAGARTERHGTRRCRSENQRSDASYFGSLQHVVRSRHQGIRGSLASPRRHVRAGSREYRMAD